MSLAITAPVGDKNRITIADKKGQKFKPVANKPEDVKMVQLFLIANGYKVPIDGKVNASVIKAIRAFQKSACGFKKPDGIIDPGGKSWKAGFGKLKTKHEANLKELANRVEITENGKVKHITIKEFEKRQAEMLRKFSNRADGLIGQAESWESFAQGAEKTMQGTDGFMMQMTEFTVRWANKAAEPPWNAILNARSEAKFLKSLTTHSKPNWEKISAQETKAVKAHNAGKKAFKKYIDARIGTASAFAGSLEIVRDTSFTVVEVYVTAQIVIQSKGKIKPYEAQILAATTVEGIKSSAGQVGEVLAGNNVTFEGAAKKVALDMFFAGAGAAITGKLGPAMAKKFAGDFSVQLFSKLGTSKIPKEAIDKMITSFLKSGAGQAYMENMAKETFMLLKTGIEKGKITGKDFQDAFFKAATAGLLKGGIGKALSKFSADRPARTSLVVGKLVYSKYLKGAPDFLRKLYPDEDNLTKVLLKHGPDIAQNLSEKVSGKITETAVLKTVDMASGTENDKQLGKLYEAELRKSKALHDELDKLIKDEVGKHYKKLEKAN
ncbi:peptidoglycan-binding protein [uncultured Tateyamaria sp.]|uniref:peptidoglycan-binding domain-containing protein n=1 Tax=uncultured Tateyamaria sp. TaxID=455651 RepID=UPI00262DED90|nr:peptidoglycan-binding protein [uncultured Tateyamaria sp.]